MSLYHRICTLALALLLCLSPISASSPPARPLKRVAHPDTLKIEILPRQPQSTVTSYGKRSFPIDAPTLRYTDTFRLTLRAFDETFYLHLRPNDHLVHPAARIKYYRTTPDGQVVLTHTEPLLRESVKAYWGEVVSAHATVDRMREDAVGVLPRPSGSELGWARIMVHHQGDAGSGVAPTFEGAFSAHGVVHHVMTKDHYMRTKHQLDPHVDVSDVDADSALVIWRDLDVMSVHEEALASLDSGLVSLVPGRTCGHDRLPHNTDPALNPVLRKAATPASWYDPLGILDTPVVNASFNKRDDVAGGNMSTNFANTIGETAGCPTTQKVLYMGVAADCEYTATYGAQVNATQQILTDWNTASALYKSTFNVSLGIVELQVQDETCPSTADPSVPWNVGCSSNVTLNDRLSIFSQWRGDKGVDGAGLWHLMSGCPTGTEVGIAWLATLCQQTSSGQSPSVVSGTAVSTAGRTEWQVVAHETGHNFGAIHDCTDGCDSDDSQCCPLSSSSCDAGSQFIMNPVAASTEKIFSQCTLGAICSLMQTGASGGTNASCLVDATAARTTISLQMCGNGIVEDGEECDPGPGTNSTCCNAATCRLNAGAQCDPLSSSCCTGTCAFAPTTQVCRPAQDALCDTAEMCTGTSSACPADVFAANGKSCGSDGLVCTSGTCTSLDKQCQTAGASLNLQKACPAQNDKSCQVSCEDPTNSNQCVLLQSALIDGSSCGYGGTCQNGTCQAGSILDTAKSWYRQNLQIAIPVTIVVGVVILLLLLGLVTGLRRCCARRRVYKGADPALAGGRPQRIPSWPAQMDQAGPGVPPLVGQNAPQPSSNRLSRASQHAPPGRAVGWVDDRLYNGTTAGR